MTSIQFPSIIILYTGNFRHRKAILATFGKKFRSSKSTQPTIPRADNSFFVYEYFSTNIIIDGILQQTNQYVGKLLLIVYFSVFLCLSTYG
jgi:chromosome condensin MukBEF MukE localization factor